MKDKMVVHPKSGTPLKQYKWKWNRLLERMEILTKHIKISNKWKIRNNNETEQEKLFKNMGWPNKTIQTKKKSYKNCWIQRN